MALAQAFNSILSLLEGLSFVDLTSNLKFVHKYVSFLKDLRTSLSTEYSQKKSLFLGASPKVPSMCYDSLIRLDKPYCRIVQTRVSGSYLGPICAALCASKSRKSWAPEEHTSGLHS